jgi:putative phosphoribosyl transferase
MTQTMFAAEADAVHFNVTADYITLDGTLVLPLETQGVVIFASGDGFPRLSPRKRAAARQLNRSGFATLLFDMFAAEADPIWALSQGTSPDLPLLARRLVAAADQIGACPETCGLPLGYFGVGTGSAAALLAAAERPDVVRAVVLAGGLPDLASSYLRAVRAPTLLIVGGDDLRGITRNQAAVAFLPEDSALALVPGVRSLVEQPAAAEQATAMAIRWFTRFLV